MSPKGQVGNRCALLAEVSSDHIIGASWLQVLSRWTLLPFDGTYTTCSSLGGPSLICLSSVSLKRKLQDGRNIFRLMTMYTI